MKEKIKIKGGGGVNLYPPKGRSQDLQHPRKVPSNMRSIVLRFFSRTTQPFFSRSSFPDRQKMYNHTVTEVIFKSFRFMYI